MKKKLIEVLGIVAAFSLCVGVINQGSTVVEAQVSQNLEKILEVDSDVLTSSNPFDYTENKYYENIVNQGMDAADVLTDGIIDKNEASLDGYVAALAVEDITGVDVGKITGEDWESADEFWDLWNEIIKDMPSYMEELANESTDFTQDIKDYGVFGEVFVKQMIDDESGNILYVGTDIKYDRSKFDNKELESCITSDDSEIEKAKSYLEKYMKN